MPTSRSVSADPRGEMTLYAVCWNGEFVLAMDNEYEGHKYFDYEDFVPDGGMDITPVVLSFGGADNQFLFWYRPDPDELQSPNQFLRAWGGLNRGEMVLSGRAEISRFSGPTGTLARSFARSSRVTRWRSRPGASRVTNIWPGSNRGRHWQS